jgi:hypothetical protein
MFLVLVLACFVASSHSAPPQCPVQDLASEITYHDGMDSA